MKNNTLLLTLWVMLCYCGACKAPVEEPNKDDDQSNIVWPPANNGHSNRIVNDWIYKNMDLYYLWSGNLPKKEKTDTKLNPDKYFESLLYQPGIIDKYSRISDDVGITNANFQGHIKSPGFLLVPFYTGNQDELICAVGYIIKGGPAERMGLKRGDLISKINGVTTTIKNIDDLWAADVLTLTLENTTKSTVTITKEQLYQNPIDFHDIIRIGSKKVGYLVYHQFIDGIKSDLNLYNNELRSIFLQFKNEKIDNLVLDLRYNSGGDHNASTLLTSLMMKENAHKLVMDKWVYSEKYSVNNNIPKTGEIEYFLNEPNRLPNINRIFVLTGSVTSSAAEALINNLKPYREVILIGEKTEGENVGTLALDDAENNYRFKWIMLPAAFRVVNAHDEATFAATGGFTPDYNITDNILPFKAFGDPDETLLKVALDIINGSYSAPHSRKSSLKKSAFYLGPYDKHLSSFEIMKSWQTRSFFQNK